MGFVSEDSTPTATLHRETTWVCLILGGFLASRLPGMLTGAELNVDESHTLAQALRYAQDIVPWRSSDGTSGGPVNSWFLLAALKLGLPYGYQAVHLLAAVCWTLTLAALHLACRRAFGVRPALCALVALACWLGVQQADDMLAYSSETVPVLLLSLALWAGEAGLRGRLFAAFALGWIPWTKPQVVPIALAVGSMLILRTLFAVAAGAPRSVAWRVARGLALAVAALLPSVLVLSLVLAGGAWEDMRSSYLDGNLSYARSLDLTGVLLRLRHYLTTAEVSYLLWGLFAITLGGLLAAWRTRAWSGLGARLAFGWLLLGVALASCLRSPYSFAHYQLLLVPGIFLGVAGAVAVFERLQGLRGRLPVLLAPLLLAILLLQGAGVGFTSGRRLAVLSKEGTSVGEMHRLVREQWKVTGPVAVWGWRPAFYVLDGRAAPTRHTICHFLFPDTPSAAHLRSTFVADLKASRPELILDVQEEWAVDEFGYRPAGRYSEIALLLASEYQSLGRFRCRNVDVIAYRRITSRTESVARP